jgi:hypothetical protein
VILLTLTAVVLLVFGAALGTTGAVTGRLQLAGGIDSVRSAPAAPAPFQVVNFTANNTTVDVTMAFNVSVNVVNLTGGAINATNTSNYSFVWTGLPAFVPGNSGSGCMGVSPINYSAVPDNDSSLLNCTAATAGTLKLSVTVTNLTSTLSNSSTTLSIVVNSLPILAAFHVSEQNSTLGTQIWFNATASGGTAPLIFSYGGLPLGCAGNTSSFSCTPTRAGLYNVTVTVLDQYGYNSSSLGEKVTVSTAKTSSPGIGTTGWAVVIGIIVVGAIITIALLLQARREERAGRMGQEESRAQAPEGSPPMGGSPPSPPPPS